MKIAICEDLREDMIHLSRLIDEYLKTNNLESDLDIFTCGEDLLQTFYLGKYQIIFLDIYMDKDKLSGMQTAKKSVKWITKYPLSLQPQALNMELKVIKLMLLTTL